MATIGTTTNANGTNIGNNASVTFASNGTALVSWYDGTNVKVSYASSPYTSWTSLTVSAASGQITGQRLDTSDTVNLILYVSGGIDYVPITLSGTTYSVGSLVSVATGSSGGNSLSGMIMEKDSQNRYWAVTTDRAGSNVLVYETTTPTTASWTSNHTVAWTSATFNEFPAGGIVGNYLLFLYPSATSTFDYQRLDVHNASLGSWSAATAFTPGGSSVTNGNFMSFRGNSTAGVEANDSGSGIWARVYNPSTDTWATAVQLSSGASDAKPTVISGSDGNFYVVWQSFIASNNYAIVYKKYNVSNSTWDTNATTLISSGANNFTVSGGSGHNTVGIVYQTGTASPYNVNFASFSLSTTAQKSAGLRLRMSALKQLSSGIRVRMSALAQKSAGIRVIMATPHKVSTGVRVRMIATSVRSAGLRLRMSAIHRQSTGLRLRLAVARNISTGLRLLMSTLGYRSVGMRVILAHLSRVGAGLRFNMLGLNTNAYTVIVGTSQIVTVVQGTLQVDQTIGKRAQASFTVYTPNTNTHFQQYQAVSIYDQNKNLVFTGYVTSPKEQKPGFANSLLTQITCADQHYLADKRIIAKVYAGRTRASIVQDILDTILTQEGVTLGAIVPEDANVATLYPSTTLYPSATLYPQGNAAGLVNATFTYATVAQALDALTKDANQSGIPYYWTIDQYKRLWWVPYTYSVNKNVVDGSAIDQITTPATLTRANPLYRNTQYIVGGTNQTSTQTETRTGDGSTRSWTMGFPLASAPQINVNSGSGYVAQTVGIKGIDTNKQFYWSHNDSTITQDSSQTVLSSSATLQVIYIGQYPVTTTASNQAQITAQAALDLSSGIVEEVEVDASLTTSADGQNKATGLITRYGTPGMFFEFTTLDTSFAPGQMRTFNYAPHGLNNVQMLIEKVSSSDQTDGVNIWNTINAVYGPYDQSWQDFFSTLIANQQATQAINAGVQGIIQTSQQFSVAVSLASSMTATISTLTALYGTNNQSTTLSTAGVLAVTTGGTETFVTTHITGGGQYGECTARGGSVTAVSSLPTPTGLGWTYQPGATTLPAGNWSSIVTASFADWQSSNSLIIRFYKLSSGTYTSIGTITTNVTSNAKTIYQFNNTSLSSVTFNSNDLLYIDLWLNDTSGTGGDNPTIYVSNNANAGVANDMQIIIP